MRNKLIGELEEYIPFNEQEERDKTFILKMLKNEPDIFLRTCEHAHMSVSGWVVNRDHTKAIMAYHNIYKSWSWLGGHADGDENLLAVAIKEVREESGIKTVTPVDGKIFSVEVLTVDGHVKKGKYVSSHLHLNITYLLEADDTEMVAAKEDENSAVAWFSLEEALESSNEEWFKEHIYRKLIDKMKQLSLCVDEIYIHAFLVENLLGVNVQVRYNI